MVRASTKQGNQREMERGGTERQRKREEAEIILSDISSNLLSWEKQRFVGFPCRYLLFISVSILNDIWETLLSFEFFGLLNL